jgi:hypothetical protein
VDERQATAGPPY